MRQGALSLYSKVISFLILLLGYTSCDDPVDEYGTPAARYKVSGKVVSVDGDKKQAIKGIRVVVIDNVDENEGKYVAGDTTYTSTEGLFEINRHDFPRKDFKIKFQDIDGTDNGEFDEKIEVIDFKNAEYKGGSGWYKGEATKDMGTVELTTKKDTE